MPPHPHDYEPRHTHDAATADQHVGVPDLPPAGPLRPWTPEGSHNVPLRDWTPEEQAEHRATLEQAVGEVWGDDRRRPLRTREP